MAVQFSSNHHSALFNAALQTGLIDTSNLRYAYTRITAASLLHVVSEHWLVSVQIHLGSFADHTGVQ